jgi:hypothetical protein
MLGFIIGIALGLLTGLYKDPIIARVKALIESAKAEAKDIMSE